MKILFFLVVFVSFVPKSIPEPGFKINSGLHGHWQYYQCNFPQYPTNNPLGFGALIKRSHEFLTQPKDNVIKFMSIEVRPHLFVERDEFGFAIWGPLYSLVHEAAKLINYSLDGINLKIEEPLAAFAIFKPDFMIGLFHPMLDFVRLLHDEKTLILSHAMFGSKKISDITKAIGEVELHSIMYWTRPPHRALFSFVTIFDSQTWICTAVAIIALSFCTHNSKVSSWPDWCFLIITSTLNLTFNICRFRQHLAKIQIALLLIWIVICMLLEVFFGGDMLAELAKEAKPIVIDSLENLSKESIKIHTMDINIATNEIENNTQIKPTFDHPLLDELWPRVQYLTMGESLNHFLAMKKVFGTKKHPKTDGCYLSLKSSLFYLKRNYEDGWLDQLTHVSNFVSAEFHVFISTVVADDYEKYAMDYV